MTLFENNILSLVIFVFVFFDTEICLSASRLAQIASALLVAGSEPEVELPNMF